MFRELFLTEPERRARYFRRRASFLHRRLERLNFQLGFLCEHMHTIRSTAHTPRTARSARRRPLQPHRATARRCGRQTAGACVECPAPSPAERDGVEPCVHCHETNGSARPVHGLCSACARCVRGASIAWRMHGMCLQVVEQLRVRGHREAVGPAPRELTREDTAPGGRHAPGVSLTRAAALRCALCAAAVRCGCAVRASAACKRCPRPSGRRGGLTHVGAACGREAAWYECGSVV